MKIRAPQFLTLVGLLAFGVHAAEVAPGLKKLETARAALTSAVERIKQDPPSNADLDAALAAVEALKVVIDANAELEQSDLDYAKAALAARKELRTQREYVEQRRANVKIFDARRALDGALKTLTEAGKALQAKDPAAADFAALRSAADAVKKLADDARPFGKQDPKFASYLTETDATVEKQLKAADDRETALAVEKQRALVDEARQGLKTAAGAIGKDATDEQFKAGDAAATALAKQLDAGKPLEAKSKAWQAEAAKARAELAAAKQKMDGLWTATGLARLKGEIEPQHRDLQAAARPLRGKPSNDQVAEARTAAIVVRKLIEKFQPEAQRSEAFGQYVEQVRKTLVDVETLIEQRTLSAAQRDVTEAQRNVEKPTPTEEQFQELATALAVLEKTLASVHTKEPLMAKPVADAEWQLKESKKTLEKRRVEVMAANEQRTLSAAQHDVTEAQKSVEKPTPTDEQFQELATALTVLEKTLAGVHTKEPLMAKAVADAEFQLKESKKTLDRRRVEVMAQGEQRALTAAQRDVTTAQKNVEKPNPTDEQFQELATALTVLEKTLASAHTKEPLMAKAVADAEWQIKGTRTAMDKRRLQVDVERQMAKVEEARKLTSEAMQQLQQPAFTREQIQQAENGVKLIGTVLAKGTALIEKDNRYSFYDGEVKKRAAEVTEKIAAKKVVLAAREAKAVLVDGTAAAKAKIEVARAPEGKDSDVNAAVQAVEAIGKALEAQAALEKQNPAYAAQAEKTRNELFVITDKLEFAKLARDLRKKTSEMLAAGVAAVAAGQADKNLRGRKGQYEKALGLFRSCQSDGAQLTEGLPALAKLPVLVEGRPMSPREVMALCEQRAGEADQLMKGVAPLIKFEDGPKKSYEAGKALLEKGKKTEALAQYNECVATGIILQHDQPAMTDTKYEVAGTQLTLGEIIKQCVAQRKALMGK